MAEKQPQRSKCRSCSAAIVWALTEHGKRIPLDAEPVDNGNMLLEPANDTATVWRARVIAPLFDAPAHRYMPHHATCPQGREWRRG